MRPPGSWQDIALALARLSGGDRAAADAALRTLIERDPSSAYEIAGVYALRDQANETFTWLDRAFSHREDEVVVAGFGYGASNLLAKSAIPWKIPLKRPAPPLLAKGLIDTQCFAGVSAVTEQTAELSPRTKARIAGVFYLLTILTGAFALVVNEPWRTAMLLGSTGCYIAVTILFYGLFRPVNRDISAIAAVFSLIGCALSILGFFQPALLRLNPLVFFGCYCLVIGYLILRSTFLPRILGVLMVFGGLGWLTFISPALANYLSPYNMAPGVLGEAALTVWLLAAGVNARRWSEQAEATA